MTMAKAKDTKAPIALPSIDEIESVAPDAMPESTRGVLGDDERKLAEKVIAAAHDGNVARGPEIAVRKDAASAAARIKRLLTALWKHDGIAVADRPTVKTSVVPKGSGFAWAIKLAPATPDAAIIDGDDLTPVSGVE